jgi:hypothetical protein
MPHTADLIIVALLLLLFYCVYHMCKAADKLMQENNDLRHELEELKQINMDDVIMFDIKHDLNYTGRNGEGQMLGIEVMFGSDRVYFYSC